LDAGFHRRCSSLTCRQRGRTDQEQAQQLTGRKRRYCGAGGSFQLPKLWTSLTHGYPLLRATKCRARKNRSNRIVIVVAATVAGTDQRGGAASAASSIFFILFFSKDAAVRSYPVRLYGRNTFFEWSHNRIAMGRMRVPPPLASIRESGAQCRCPPFLSSGDWSLVVGELLPILGPAGR
jgi:hypothetical protein